VFQLFANWVLKKIEPSYDENALRKLVMNVAGAGIVKLGSLFASNDVILAGVAPNATLGAPTEALQTDKGSEVVRIPASKEVLFPLGPKEYLQFAGDVGRDQSTLTVRDPRSLEAGHASTAQVFRKDETYVSNFLQEVKPGRYPVIAEAIGIQHRPNVTP
jgi:hypothetical protein